MSKIKSDAIIQDKTTSITGNVIINHMINNTTVGSFKIKNNVTLQFLAGLARFSRGDFRQDSSQSSNYLPYYLGVGDGRLISGELVVNRDSLKAEHNLTYRFDATPNTIAVESESIIKLYISAYIPSQILINQQISEIGLFSTRNFGSNTLLARVEFEEDIYLNAGEALQIEWQFLFGNAHDLV